MNAEDIVIMQNVAVRSDKAHMIKFLDERETFIRDAMNALDREDMQNEDYELEELVALNK